MAGADVASSTAAAISSVASASSLAANLTVSEPSLSKLTSLVVSAHHLLIFPLRILYRAEVILFVTLPRHFVRLLGLDTAMAFLINGTMNMFGAGDADAVGGEAAAAAAAAAAAIGMDGAVAAGPGPVQTWSLFSLRDIFQTMRRFGGVFSYMTSRWSVSCFGVALLLNRVTVYASTRRHVSLSWTRRLALRIIPIILFAGQVLTLLRAIRCQTSPEYPVLRYGKPGKHSSLDHAGEGGFLYNLTSFLLSWESDVASCSAVSMGRPASSSGIPYGSYSLLWPVFVRICLGHFVETLSCALQGRIIATEAGMSIFEHSLAFAEAESVISQSIGLGIFGLAKPSGSTDRSGSSSASSSVKLLSRAQVLERLNVTPELLLIALISCCNSLCSNVLDVFGQQSRYRLANTAIWGLCFMASMVWGFLSTSALEDELAVLRFPTVCIVGFVPHIIVLIGILMCVSIYGIALLLTAVSLPGDPENPVSFREAFALARENMQGSLQINNIRFNSHEDFYTSLIRVGHACLSAASEAVFLNEGRPVISKNTTWLEEDRLAEIMASRDARQRRSSIPYPIVELDEGSLFDLPAPTETWETGYGREKKLDKRSGSSSTRPRSKLGSVGAFVTPTRAYLGFAFFRSIFILLLGWSAFGLAKLVERLGLTPPRWLISLAGVIDKGDGMNRPEGRNLLDFWILTDEGELQLPRDHDFDVEREMRRREAMNARRWGPAEENQLEGKLYNWWKHGGSWGDQDGSGDYAPSTDNLDDATSVVSMSTNDDSEWESWESDGRRTPTQQDPYPSQDRSGALLSESLLDPTSLARLLDPKDKETKEEARILASHLLAENQGRIMTRSQFRSQVERERARVLTLGRLNRSFHNDQTSPPGSNGRRRPTADEEAEMLENLILSRRLADQRAQHPEAAESDHSEGPQCVVCQCQPRSIIAWPCRCLCVCEDCRVSLAMNNFASCVTCRREVHGFVRLWVP